MDQESENQAELLFKQFEDIKHVYSLELGRSFPQNDKDDWHYGIIRLKNMDQAFTTEGIENHYERILNFFVKELQMQQRKSINLKSKHLGII